VRVAALACIAGGLGIGAALTQEPPRFGVAVDAVYLDVLVSRGGQAVTGLRASDFQVLDEGVPQELHMIAAGEAPPLYASLVLDTSGSVEGDLLAALKVASRSFLEGLPGHGRASLITFSDTIRLMAGPAPAPELLAALSRSTAGGGTALNDALFSALLLSQPVAGRSLVVAFTDGLDSASWLSASHVRAVARASDATVYVVGIDPALGDGREASPWRRRVRHGTRSSDFDVRETSHATSLRELAEETGGGLLLARSPDGLRDTFARILAENRTRYLLSFSPRGGGRSGWHALTVRLQGRAGEVRARRGYVKREAGAERDR
jgi:VWFA-related protein